MQKKRKLPWIISLFSSNTLFLIKHSFIDFITINLNIFNFKIEERLRIKQSRKSQPCQKPVSDTNICRNMNKTSIKSKQNNSTKSFNYSEKEDKV